MSLITETNEEYYAGQHSFVGDGVTTEFPTTFNTDLTLTTTTGNGNFTVIVNGVSVTPVLSSTNPKTVVINPAPTNGYVVEIKLSTPAVWNNYGGYSYITLNDLIDNFLVGYVGHGKLVSSAKRTDILFHAKRGLQEFSYDTLKSIKSQEVTIPPSLSLPIPQDYVNYVQLSWIDDLGVKHIIYPTTLTSNPYTVPIQDDNGDFIQDNFGENEESSSLTDERWKNAADYKLNGNYNVNLQNAGVYNWNWEKLAYGQRYGLDPQYSNKNGWFTINEREGKFSFSSNLTDRLIILEYISDGLSSDLDTKVPKMAEEAMYMHIAYAMLAGRQNVPEYIVNRFKKDRRAALRNAKIRLSNIKLDEFVQIMRGKSKWIKS
tara:strand:- start:18234 stop:19358 length:1125 start_codon:yes stop_codon:yes gene_type:complete